jgi:negative regulator of sigma E activity
VCGDSLLRELVTSEDVRATWESYPLADRRAVLRGLVTVTIMPVGHRIGRAVGGLVIRQREYVNWELAA